MPPVVVSTTSAAMAEVISAEPMKSIEWLMRRYGTWSLVMTRVAEMIASGMLA